MPDDPEQPRILLAQRMPAAPSRLLDGLAAYLDLIVEYSAVLNLTGFRLEPEHLVDELVGEAIRLHDLAPIAAGTRAVDLGSGNGSPVVPLAIVNPAVEFTAVESRARRAAFLRTVQARLDLGNLAVAEQRVEHLAARQPGAFGLVTSRAFAPLEQLVPLAYRLLAAGGELRGYLGPNATPLAPRARNTGFTVAACEQYRVGDAHRHVYLLRKQAAAHST